MNTLSYTLIDFWKIFLTNKKVNEMSLDIVFYKQRKKELTKSEKKVVDDLEKQLEDAKTLDESVKIVNDIWKVKEKERLVSFPDVCSFLLKHFKYGNENQLDKKITREQIESFISKCSSVLDEHSARKLPYDKEYKYEYDEWYFGCVEETRDFFKKVLDETK